MVSLNYNLLSSNFQTLPFFSENSSDHLQDSLYQDFQDLQHLENVKYCQDFLDSNFDVTLPSNITSKSSFMPSFPLFLFYICISLSAQHTFSFYHLSYIFAQKISFIWKQPIFCKQYILISVRFIQPQNQILSILL